MNNQKGNKYGAFSSKGWNGYNVLQKKVREQKFSWTGLIVSCSVAFFIVLSSAFALGMLFKSIEGSIPEARAEVEKVLLVETVRKV